MSKRGILFGRSMPAVIGVVAVAAIAAVVYFTASGNKIGDTDISPDSTAKAPLPEIMGTPEPTDPGLSGDSGAPGAASTPEIKGDFDPQGQGISLDPPPTIEELRQKYPNLELLLRNLNLDDREKLEAAYAQLLEIYQNEGFAGLQTVIEEAGILEALNIDSAYLDFVMVYKEDGIEGAEELARQRGLITANDELRMIVILDTEDTSVLEPALSELGGKVLRQYRNEIEVGVPIQRIKDMGSDTEFLYKLVEMAHLEHVVGVQAPELTKPNLVPSQDEGPGVTGADLWHQNGIIGDGVKVGIIDPDGFNGFMDLLGTKLPPAERVFVYPNDPQFLNARTGLHGTACAEIVHEMAPGAELYLAYSGGSDNGLGDSIDWMIANGVKIISYSASSLIGPRNGTGPVAELVSQATARGILWINSSGNYAQTHLKTTFTDTDGNGWHEFPDGDEIMRMRPYEGGTVVGLSWDDTLNGATQNYDLYVLVPKTDGTCCDVFTSERSAQSGRAADHPFEILYYEFTPEELAAREYALAIRAVNSTYPAQFNLLADGLDLQYWMTDSSLGAPADSADVLAVGATNWRDDSLEPFSSQGPTDDGRLKPDITAPDYVTSSPYGEFPGTSASAPHVAGAAALVWGFYSEASSTDVRDYLLLNATDLGPAGMDNGYGVGRLTLPAPPQGKEVPPSGPPAFTLEDVWQEHNVSVSGIKGMKIHLVFRAENFQNNPGTASVVFSNQDTGQALKDANGSYANSNGDVAVSQGFTPLYQPTLYSDFTLFMPYDELEVDEGSHNLQFQVSLSNDADGQVLASSDLIPFNYQRSEAVQPLASMGDVDIEFNRAEAKQVGMNILVTFDVANLRSQEGEVAIYFFFKDASNRRLKDYNDKYRDPNGFVAVGKAFTPGSNNTTYDKLNLFMPYGELHLYESERYNLKFQVVIWDKASGKQLTVSDWVYFWYEP